MTSEIYPLVHPIANIGNISRDGSLAEISKSIQKQLDALAMGIEIVDKSIHIETAYGRDIDKLMWLFDRSRFESECDDTFRNRILDFIANLGFTTSEIVSDVIENITGLTPVLEEGDGEIDVELPINKLEYADEIHVAVNVVKAAGIAFMLYYDDTTWMENFSEPVVTVEDLLLGLLRTAWEETIVNFPIIPTKGWDKSEWDNGTWDDVPETPSDVFFAYLGLSFDESLESYTISETELLIGMFFTLDDNLLDIEYDDVISGLVSGLLVEEYTPHAWDHAQWDYGIWDTILGYEELDFSIIFDIDFSSYQDELYGEILCLLEESLSDTDYDDIISGLIAVYSTESFPINVSTWISISGDIKANYTETFSRRSVSKIGTAKIGTATLAIGSIIIENLHEWDSGKWDSAYWDYTNSDRVLYIEEAF